MVPATVVTTDVEATGVEATGVEATGEEATGVEATGSVDADAVGATVADGVPLLPHEAARVARTATCAHHDAVEMRPRSKRLRALQDCLTASSDQLVGTREGRSAPATPPRGNGDLSAERSRSQSRMRSGTQLP